MAVSREEIRRNLEEIRGMIPQGVELIAVSKFQPVEAVEAAYEAGQRRFGESRVQELIQKIPALPADIQWHFIGHLQTNKVKALAGKVALIESVDSLKLLEVIDSEYKKIGYRADVLLQVHVAREETKFGFSPEELLHYINEREFSRFENVRLRGLMAMASNTDDKGRVRGDFARVAALFREIKKSATFEDGAFDTLSMGMSGDWPIAVEEGATSVRIGSAIFGARY